MRELIPDHFVRADAAEGEALRLVSAQGSVFAVSVRGPAAVRVRHFRPEPDSPSSATPRTRSRSSSGTSGKRKRSAVDEKPPLRQATSHAVAPRAQDLSPDVNVHGLSRDLQIQDDSCFSLTVNAAESQFVITTTAIRVVVSLSEESSTPALVYSSLVDNVWTPFLEDLPHRGYPLLKDTFNGARHFVKRRDQDLHYGLGERASPLTLNGRRFRLETMDALGYNAETTDPLYKLIPFHITLDTVTRVAHGIFYDSFAQGFADFGQEIDAFWGPYRSHTLLDGCGLDMYVFFGPSISSVVERYTALVGRPAFPPKYALGYLASSMGYAESNDAQRLIAQLPADCRKWDVPCDMLHLSSGYTVDEKTGARNVFTWNKTRFPDPAKLFKELRDEGIRVSANIKPWLLCEHPNYQEVKDASGFIVDAETNGPRITRLWSAGNGASATGSYFDFSSDAGRQFWKRGVTALLGLGIESIWNDNNEFSLPDDGDIYAHSNAHGTSSTVGAAGRGLQTMLMASASYEAMVEHNNKRRPFLITRSGVSGIQRFAAQSWSGDNFTSWHTLKHNIPMGLNCGLSGLAGYGHDIGGFVGPRPEQELFVRWIQNGIWHPRFCVHSWKDEGVTELWMYPEVFSIIREAVHLRYKLLPYLYTLHHEAFKYGHPVIRPLVYEFQHDQNVQSSSFEFMLGPHILVASVFEKEIRTRSLVLPALKALESSAVAWCNLWTGEWVPGGAITVGCKLEDCGAVFARRGAIVPTGPVIKYVGEPGTDNERTFWLFPPSDAREAEEWCGTLFEDDGETVDGSGTTEIAVQMKVVVDEVVVNVGYGASNSYAVQFETVWFVLPKADTRAIKVVGRAGSETKSRVELDGRSAVGVSVSLFDEVKHGTWE
ncbi:hypothetical protein HDU82_004969 [Entophlyctis luteolus]|nr:hypothetical protein HDU82_004969 [Entophlyctis luteolus]